MTEPTKMGPKGGVCPDCGETFGNLGPHRKHWHPETYVPARRTVMVRTRADRMERVRAAEARRAEAGAS